MSKLCPSAQPGMENCRVLGVMQSGELAYLNQHLSVTDEVLAMAAPLKPAEVFRFAATCQEQSCSHFDGKDCRLATRIVQILPAVTEVLPPCLIRRECRWYGQEGGAACKRCPQVTTVNYNASDRLQEVAGVAAMSG